MTRINLLSPEFRANPYPYYAMLRCSPPTSVDPGNLWAVSRYDDVLAVLKNPMVFSSQGFRVAAIQSWIPHNPIVDSMIFFDPPRHTSIRSLVTHAFTSRVLPRVEPLARNVAAEFAQRAQAGTQLDVCQELGLKLPAAVIANLLGFDSMHSAKIRSWTEDLHSISAITPVESRQRIAGSVAELAEYIKEVFDARRLVRRADLASDLLDAEIAGERLSEEELIGFMFLLLVAGFETTGHLIAQAIHILARYPALVGRLRTNPGQIPDFIEEVLRFEPGVHGLMRLVLRDTNLGGVSIPAGSVVVAMLASANRDETRLDHPEDFDMDRRQRPNLSFGNGIHFCLGAALARAEARIALEELVPRIRAVRTCAEPEWNHSLTVRGPVRLPVVFEPASDA